MKKIQLLIALTAFIQFSAFTQNKRIKGPICFGENTGQFYFDTLNNSVYVLSKQYSPVNIIVNGHADQDQINSVLDKSWEQNVFDPNPYFSEEPLLEKFAALFPGYDQEKEDDNIYYHFADDTAAPIVRDTLYTYEVYSKYKFISDTLALTFRKIEDETNGVFDSIPGINYEPYDILSGAKYIDLNNKKEKEKFNIKYGIELDSPDDKEAKFAVIEKDLDGDKLPELITITDTSSHNSMFAQRNYSINIFKKDGKVYKEFCSYSFDESNDLQLAFVKFSGIDHYYLYAWGQGPCSHFRVTTCESIRMLLPLTADHEYKCTQVINY